MKKINQIRGYWKFSDKKTTPEDLEKFLVENWQKDNKFTSLHIRRVSKDQWGIGFTYNPEIETEKEFSDKFNDDCKDTLYKAFGTSLIGWDISNYFYLVK